MSQLINIQNAAPCTNERHRIQNLPILLLSLHSRCNCRCVMCDIWQRQDSETYHAADLERHRASFEQLGVRHVVLTGGEPLLNREFAEICAFFHTLAIRVTLLTTGLLLERKAATVAAGVDDIILSIDGPAEIHDLIRRVPNAFQTIARGVRALRELRPAVPVSCRTTVQKLNHTHLRATVDAAHELGLNSISFLPADLSSAAFNRELRWTDSRQEIIALTARELIALTREIKSLIVDCADDVRSGFIAENEAKLRRLAMRFQEHLEGSPAQAPVCNAPWVSSVMEVDGSLRPCFFHPVTGSTKVHTLKDALNSEASLAFRSTLDVARNPTCQHCVCSLHYRTGT